MSLRRSTRVSKRPQTDGAPEDEVLAVLEEKPKRTRRSLTTAAAAPAAESAETGAGPAEAAAHDAELDAKEQERQTKAMTKKAAAELARQAKREEAERDREERGVSFRKSCPASTTARIQRALYQRLYLLSRRAPESQCSCPRSTPHHTEFAVLGSTGNVYDVTICRNQTCSCPDGQRGAQCKHILFVMLKVLQVPRTSPVLYQDALIPSELEEIFANAPQGRTTVEAPKAARDAYKKMAGEDDESKPDAAAAADEPKPKDYVGEFCGICYDVLAEADEITWCKSSCGKSVHKGCFTHWEKAQTGRVTCVYCRAPWPTAAGAGAAAGAAGSSEGYTNLSHLSGQDSYRPEFYGYGYGRYGYYRDY
eukprot:m.11819 g.11819  ORF g.11819 m.11819 type:complete len:365 (+) comp5873_c0_seq1:129-1223(+)